jgi:hypothetical protein
MMPQHKLIDTNQPTTAGAIAILGVLALVLLSAYASKHDAEANLTNCPTPGHGQQLIGQGHAEADGYPGELYCTYSTAPIYDREQVSTQNTAPVYSKKYFTKA